MRPSSLTTKNTSESDPSPACGNAPSPFTLLEVRMTLPKNLGMFTYSLSTIESFAATGWRIGWLVGPPSIIGPTLAATTRIVFCTNSPLQEAVAAGLEKVKENKFFETQLREYSERRDILLKAFDDLGLKYTHPEGSYFVLLVRPSSKSLSSNCFIVIALLHCYSRMYPGCGGPH